MTEAPACYESNTVCLELIYALPVCPIVEMVYISPFKPSISISWMIPMILYDLL